jgi:hypothetical protein
VIVEAQFTVGYVLPKRISNRSPLKRIQLQGYKKKRKVKVAPLRRNGCKAGGGHEE